MNPTRRSFFSTTPAAVVSVLGWGKAQAAEPAKALSRTRVEFKPPMPDYAAKGYYQYWNYGADDFTQDGKECRRSTGNVFCLDGPVQPHLPGDHWKILSEVWDVEHFTLANGTPFFVGHYCLLREKLSDAAR